MNDHITDHRTLVFYKLAIQTRNLRGVSLFMNKTKMYFLKRKKNRTQKKDIRYVTVALNVEILSGKRFEFCNLFLINYSFPLSHTFRPVNMITTT